jgi:hypothetical protein
MDDPKDFDGKVVVDVTNPLDFSKGMPPRLALGNRDSGSKTIQIRRMLSELQALSLINDCYKYIMDLTTNGIVVTHAIKLFRQTRRN